MDMTSDFDILPAIDLRGGRVVRLEQGDFGRETAFSDDPVAVARSFADAGARWLHVVDLDGARNGMPAHADVIKAIVDAVGDRVAVEVAGGLRTAALRDPSLVGRLVATHGQERVAVAIDVRDGRALGHGWAEGVPGIDAADAIVTLAGVGVATFEVTAIDRDGLLRGPDLALYERLVGLGHGSIIASAGIATVGHIAAVRAIGCTGAIIGRALYDGRIDLSAAFTGAGPKA